MSIVSGVVPSDQANKSRLEAFGSFNCASIASLLFSIIFLRFLGQVKHSAVGSNQPRPSFIYSAIVPSTRSFDESERAVHACSRMITKFDSERKTVERLSNSL